MKKISIAIICQLFLVGCVNSQNKTRGEYDNNNYLSYIKKFDEKFSRHFPKKMSSPFHIDCSTNSEKNDIGLMLYKYEVPKAELDSIKDYLKKSEVIAQYKPNDSCLLIVNRFETIQSHENYELPVIKDGSLIDKSCYETKYPIPNFIEYEALDTTQPMKLDKTFEIFVIDANSGKYSQYNLQPSPQMPQNWKNGFSRGIAISEQNKCVIYWAIIW